MTAFASFTDVRALCLNDLTGTQSARATKLLDQAADRIRAYTRRTFTLETSTVKLRAIGSVIVLPQKPVIAVTGLSLIDYLGNEFAVPVFGFDQIDRIDLTFYGAVLNLPEALSFQGEWSGTVKVTYEHGYAEIPKDVANLNAELVARIFNSPLQGMTGIRSQTVGPYGVGIDTTGAGGGVIALTDDDKTLLKKYRRAQQAVELR
jgi:hypothetical protein